MALGKGACATRPPAVCDPVVLAAHHGEPTMSQADKEPGPSRGKVVVATDITLTVPIRARAYRMRLPFFARRRDHPAYPAARTRARPDRRSRPQNRPHLSGNKRRPQIASLESSRRRANVTSAGKTAVAYRCVPSAYKIRRPQATEIGEKRCVRNFGAATGACRCEIPMRHYAT